MRTMLLAFFLPLLALADEPAEAPAELAEIPAVDQVIAERVAALPPPAEPAVPKGVTMAISSEDPRAQKAVQHGMVCLHTGWDFEAYRHFCMALRADPNCLMAHWGVGLALMHGKQDLQEARQAALERMLALVEHGVGTDLEKRYAFALSKLLTEGPVAAGEAFTAAAREYRGDPQLTLLTCLITRGADADEKLLEAVEKHPDLTWLRYGYLAMRAEEDSRDEELEMARQLASEAPEYPPYYHLLGHYEWRCGNHARAAHAFGRAADLYAGWMRDNGLDAVDCPSWTKAESYRAVALASKGEYETALAVADAVAAIEVPLDRADSNGGRMLMWEGRTLPVRVLLRRGEPGDMARAAKVLPPLEEVEEFGKKSLALWSYQVHSSVVAGRLAIEQKDLPAANEIALDVTRIGENFVKTREIGIRTGESSHWLRAFKAFEVMAAEFRGLIGMEGVEGTEGPSVSAGSWFQAAADRQERATLMMPPAVLLPMEVRLADYYVARSEAAKAIEVLESGLEDHPNDCELLNGLLEICESEGMTAEAAEWRRRIEALGEH